MIRIAPRFQPRARLYARPAPSHPALYYDALTRDLKNQSKTAPAREHNVLYTDLLGDNETQVDYDGLPGLPASVRPFVTTLGYDIRWIDTRVGGVGGWRHEPTAEETAAINETKAALQTTIDALRAIENPNAEQQEELKDAENIFDHISEYGHLRTAPNAMNSGASGIFWGLAAANVPVVVTSGFTLQQDRALSLRLKRLAAPKDQARHTFTIDIEARQTCYALEIGEDGNSSTFIHYRNMTKARRRALLAQLNGILDQGRLTLADRTQLRLWDEREQEIRAGAKTRSRGERKLTAAEHAEIELLHDRASALRDSKSGLSDAAEDAKRSLENQLYLAREPFMLQEEARSLIGREVDITFQWLRSGFVIVQVNDEKFVYENKRITGLEPPQYATGLPDKALITLRSDGGKWGLVYGRPNYRRRGTVWTQPFPIPFAFEDDEVSFDTESDAHATCGVVPFLFELRPPRTSGTITYPGLYQVRIDLTSSDGRYTPELYRTELHIAAGDVPAYGEPLWSADNALDLLIQDDGDRSTLAQFVVSNSDNDATLPLKLAGLSCEIDVFDRLPGAITAEIARLSAIVSPSPAQIAALAAAQAQLTALGGVDTYTILHHGLVPSQPRPRVQELDGSAGFEVEPHPGHEVHIDVVALENFLDRPVVAHIAGHNKFPNDYLRELARDAGLQDTEYSGIPSGNIGLGRIRRPTPGKVPDVQPARDARYLEFMQEVVKDWCPGYELRSDTTGLVLVLIADRVRADLAYGLPPDVELNSPLCLRQSGEGGFRLRQDLSNYFTDYYVVGAMNPVTGKRYYWHEPVLEAYTPGFEDSMYWIGFPRPARLIRDDTLKSEAACYKRALREKELTGLPPWYLDTEIDFDHSLRPRDVGTIFGIKFRGEEIDLGSLNAGDGQRMRVTWRLAEDKRLPVEP